MSYHHFAYLYDELMKDVPYEEWVQLILNRVEKYEVKGRELLDLACGTGQLSLRFAEAGFNVTGVDLSEDMLAVAQAKLSVSGYNHHFFQQNMAELQLMKEFDVVGIFCDSLNYLTSDDDVQKTFEHVYEHLKQDGLFVFDVHSIHKINEIFLNQTFTYNEEDISYIWQCFAGEFPLSVEHELTFFVRDNATDKFDRYEELHIQRTYIINQYEKWLEAAGFQVLEILADFGDRIPTEESERIFFIARKK